MNAIKKTFIGASIITLPFLGGNAFAQNTSGKGLRTIAFNATNKAKAELVAETKELNAPVVMPFESSALAERSSFGENISIHVHQDANDPISGFRYARGLANAATEAEKTGGRPMYITATYEEGASSVGSFVSVYVNGKLWEYENSTVLSPQVVAQLLPILMFEYEKEFGKDNFIPEDVTPQLVASLN